MFRIAKNLRGQYFNQHQHFCSTKHFGKQRPRMDLKILQQKMSREPNYVGKHNQQIGQQIIECIQQEDFKYLKGLLLTINKNSLGSWFLVRKISKKLNNYCNGLQLSRMEQAKIKDLLWVLSIFAFQPKSYKNVHKEQQIIKTDDSTHFVNELQRLIASIDIDRDADFYFFVFRKLAHTNPDIFLSMREQIQRKIISQANNLVQNNSLNDILMKGCVSNFWTEDFRQIIMRKNIPDSYLRALHFENMRIPTKIQLSSQSSNIKTQSEISNIFSGFGYLVDSNVLINSYEIDFLISKKLIVQFNGLHHYIINSQDYLPTARDQWRKKVLLRRNFVISSISFMQWGSLRDFEQKRQFVVKKVQNDWLFSFKSKHR